METPDVAIILPTYNRPVILAETIGRLAILLQYPEEHLYFYIGNDGDDFDPRDIEPEMAVGSRRDYARTGEFYASAGKDLMLNCDHVIIFPMTGQREPGLGANLNFLINIARKKDIYYYLQMDDDHHLLDRLPLHRHINYMIENILDGAAWVRLMGIGFHDYTARLHAHYWWVSWDSIGGTALYIPSNRPHLKHWSFHEFYGLYPEGLKLGETEEHWCHQCRNKAHMHFEEHGDYDGIPHVLVPLNPEPDSERGWAHVGDSWQRHNH